MNAIEQIMQSFGAAPSPAMAGLLGLSPAASGDSSTQFIEALQGLQSVTDVAELNTSTGGQATKNSKDPHELLAGLGITLPLEASEVQAQFNLAAAISGKAGNTPEALNPASSNSPFNNFLAGLHELQTVPSSEQGTTVPVLSQEALEQLGLKLEQLPALPSSEELAATAQAGVTSSSHIIPTEGVDGLLNAAAQQTKATQLPDGTTLVEQAAEVSIDAATDQVTAQSPVGEAQKVEASNSQLSLETATTEQATAGDPLSHAPDTGAENAAKVAEEIAAQQQAQAAPTSSEDTPEGHAAATSQQTAVNKNAKQATLNNRPGTQATDATASATRNEASTDIPASTETDDLSSKEAPRAQTADAQAARTGAQATHNRESQTPLTPERLAGHSDTAAIHSLASGLNSMKGESSFLSSMSLLGGKANPELAHQVGQQLNVNVSKAIKNGQQEFTVRLNPKELGSVRVKMSFLEDGHVQTKVMAERPETLDLLQRDVRSLEKTLEASGHKSEGAIQFSLDTNDQESAGRAFAEAVQQEKMRDELAAQNSLGNGANSFADIEVEEEIVPLEEILSNVSVDTGLDISV